MSKLDKINLEITFEEYHAITSLAQRRYIDIQQEIKQLTYIPLDFDGTKAEENQPKIDKLQKEYDLMKNLFQKAYDTVGKLLE